jgi:hypothetical protein
MMPSESIKSALPLIIRALAFASEKHSLQRRKDADASPYINHPIALLSILVVEAGIEDADVLAAALLHDTIEDTRTTEKELADAFGERIAEIVAEVTDDKALAKAERKLLQIDHAHHLSREAGMVKLADKIANLRDVANNPPADWPLVRRQEYFDWAKRVADNIQNPPFKLRALFDAAYARRPEAASVPPAPSRAGAIRMFERYVGIDYSGAEVPNAPLSGLSVYGADPSHTPMELAPPVPLRKWTRRAIAEWIVDLLSTNEPTIIGIDHGFSFPIEYFARHRLAHDWPAFLDDFQRHWPTDERNTYVDFVREGAAGYGNGAARTGSNKWRRLSEKRTKGAKSVFHFDVPGSVAKSTHAGLPWLRFIRARVGPRVHFWPFDGWEIPPGRSAIVEIYPAQWKHDYAREGRNDHQHDAYCAVAWMRRADLEGSLAGWFSPKLTQAEREIANIEGWILGVAG